MNIFKQFEPLTKDEIVLLYESVKASVEINRTTLEAWELSKDQVALQLMDFPEKYDESVQYFNRVRERIGIFEIIVDKLNNIMEVIE